MPIKCLIINWNFIERVHSGSSRQLSPSLQLLYLSIPTLTPPPLPNFPLFISLSLSLFTVHFTQFAFFLFIFQSLTLFPFHFFGTIIVFAFSIHVGLPGLFSTTWDGKSLLTKSDAFPWLNAFNNKSITEKHSNKIEISITYRYLFWNLLQVSI